MKTKITILFAVIALGLCSFKLAMDKAAATVSVVDGVEVFAFSKPTTKYDILGMVKIKGMVKNTTGPHMVDLLIELAKKDYPSAEGIIVNSDFEKAEVVRFKE